MNICLLTRMPALETGGIGRVTTEISNKLVEHGDTVNIISAVRADLLHYFKYVFIDTKFRMPKNCDIYHAITPMESIWIPKNKAIATVLDIIPITHPELQGARLQGNKIKYNIAKACFNIGCRQASKCRYIVCISNHVKNEFLKHFPTDENKVKVIRLGIREDLRPYGERSKKNFRIGYLGQLDRRKRTDKLVTAFKNSNINAELVMGGRGIDEVLLKQLAQGDKRIKLLGFIDDDNLVDFYNSLDVFVFPTAIEGYGLPAVEAMACKKPVIVLDDSIIPHDVKDRCISVKSLETLFNNPFYLEGLCKTVDYEGNHNWAKLHNWDTTVSEYYKLYMEVSK